MSRKFKQQQKHFYQEIEDEVEEHGCYNETNEIFNRDKDKLFNCVNMKNLSQLQRFLDHGLNINITNVNKQSPLHIAAGHSPCEVNKEILYILISFGCAVDTQDRFGETALHVAANKSAQNVQMLLDAGSPVNIQDNAGRTPLMIACRSESPELLNIVQFLLDRGANPAIKDTSDQTALHGACSNSHDRRAQLIYMLLNAGADANVPDLLGCTPAEMILDSPSINKCPSYTPDDAIINVKPLVCGGAKFLDNQKVTTRFTHYYGVFSPDRQRITVLQHLIDICSPVCRISCLRDLKHYIEHLEHQTGDTNKILDTLKKKLQTVRTLKETCRIVVRDSLQGRIFVNTDKLNLPDHLQKFLHYSECL
ncbi:serine/threonine-protein phosphatase 6 regulatory ankyrin repeat subunit A-like [Ruditapes philippinarum]|uniref:serine/threonine-protein phosphatase 6 regulatory ankyrin repeat subunit A-like n=1 Tax=Ruditapes philippinarum TaxID=129788 RepID=UPI00295AF14D|nr:serine/threonine-protein phosphatase 6 regulatory ankyrin repeat subunit A-like [Ruditapes philippinarum]